jgi:hypothetical protein
VPNSPENIILTNALNALKTASGLDVIRDKTLRENNPTHEADAAIQIQTQPVLVEIKRNIRPAHLGAIIQKIKTLQPTGLLISDYINPNIAKTLKESGVQYLDACGNAYINLPPILVFTTGQKPALDIKKETNKAFDLIGLKLIFCFLCDPHLVNTSYREMSEIAGIALGAVGNVLSGLVNAGYLIDQGKAENRQLINRRKLLDRWVEAYPEKLKPKLRLGEFIHDDPNWWKNIDLKNLDAHWSGEIGASKYTDYLKPQIATVYLPAASAKKFLSVARLKKATDDNSNVIYVYHTFWTEKLQNKLNTIKQDTVHPILIYADLIASADSRNLETAKVIYDKTISEYFRED